MDASALDNAISALEKEVSALEQSVDSLEKLLWFSTVLVIVGISLELYFMIDKYRSDRSAWRRGTIRSPERPSRLLLTLELFSVVLVVGGIVGELAVGIVSANKNTVLRNKNRLLVSLVNQKAGLANERAANANEAAGKANERGFKNERDSAQLRIETARIQHESLVLSSKVGEERKNLIEAQLELADRTLADSTKLREAMKVLPGIKVSIKYLDAPEPKQLAGYLSAELYQGGWKVTGPVPDPYGLMAGVFINAGWHEPAKGARNVLLRFLRDDCKLFAMPAPGSLSADDELIVQVGPKPTPILDQIRAGSLGNPGAKDQIFFTPPR
jgi:hypothetical protein